MLPKGYELPKSTGNYVKLVEGDNRFRIMSDYIVGMSYWTEKDGTRTPVRIHSEDPIHPDDLQYTKKPPKPFWACVVYDYSDQRIKIWEITQKGIMITLTGLEQDPDWGDPKGPKGYDIVINRVGKGLNDTKYGVIAKPRKELDEGIVQLFKDTKVDLNALYRGEDPFASTNSKNEEVDINEVAKALGA